MNLSHRLELLLYLAFSWYEGMRRLLEAGFDASIALKISIEMDDDASTRMLFETDNNSMIRVCERDLEMGYTSGLTELLRRMTVSKNGEVRPEESFRSTC